MNWEENVKQKSLWNGEISNLTEKERIAEKLAKRVKDGDVIGVGSGSTSFVATKAIAKRMKEENRGLRGQRSCLGAEGDGWGGGGGHSAHPASLMT